jgi:hypothetical protein
MTAMFSEISSSAAGHCWFGAARAGVDAGAFVHAGEIQELLGPGVTRRFR